MSSTKQNKVKGLVCPSVITVLALFATSLQAAPTFTGQDYSGVYDCMGQDGHEGQYAGVVTMRLQPEHSHGDYASYDFKLEVPEYGVYLGHAAAHGAQVAMHFGLSDPATQDVGTGVATMSTDARGRLTFHKFYYQPAYKGGNTGTEDCIRR